MSSPVAKKSRFSPSSIVQLPSQPLPPSAALGSSTSTTSTSADQVQSAVMRYLQKRRYTPSMTEAFQKLQSTQGLSQNKAQFAMRELLWSQASSVASLALAAPPNVDPLVTEQQYAKFKLWISESPDFYKPELAQLLYPIFTHFYLDLVLAGHKLIAQKFHKRHQSTFLVNPNFASFIRVLNNIVNPEDIQQDNGSVQTFLNTKYSVTLSNRTFHYLMRYLQQQQSMGQPHILLHVLHAKVDVRLQDALGAPSSKLEAVRRVLSDQVSINPDPVVKTETQKSEGCVTIKQEYQDELNGYIKTSTDSSLAKIESDIQAVRDGPVPLPSTIIYRLTNPYSTILCGSIHKDLLITGCEDSSLISWDLAPNAKKAQAGASKMFDDDPAVIRLGCDDLTNLSTVDNDSKKLPRKSVMRGHSGPVYDVAFTSRGRYLMSVSEDTTMRLWDLSNGVNKAIYQGHSYPIWSVDSDRVGISLVTGSMDRTAKLWHVEYTHPLRVYAGHEQDVDVVKFHPNCNYVATGGSDKTVRLWSHSDAKMVRVFNGHKGSILSLAFSPDGKYLASGGEDRRIKVWDLSTSTLFKDLRGHPDGNIQALTWSRDSGLLISGGQDGLVKFWDVQKSETSLSSMTSRCSNVIDLSFSPHNTLLACGLKSNSSSQGSQQALTKNIYHNNENNSL